MCCLPKAFYFCHCEYRSLDDLNAGGRASLPTLKISALCSNRDRHDTEDDPSFISFLYRCLASLTAVRARLAQASRLEARADPLQKCPYFLAKGMHLRFVDQL